MVGLDDGGGIVRRCSSAGLMSATAHLCKCRRPEANKLRCLAPFQNAEILEVWVASLTSLSLFSSKAAFLKLASAGQAWSSGSRWAAQKFLVHLGHSPTILCG